MAHSPTVDHKDGKNPLPKHEDPSVVEKHDHGHRHHVPEEAATEESTAFPHDDRLKTETALHRIDDKPASG